MRTATTTCSHLVLQQPRIAPITTCTHRVASPPRRAPGKTCHWFVVAPTLTHHTPMRRKRQAKARRHESQRTAGRAIVSANNLTTGAVTRQLLLFRGNDTGTDIPNLQERPRSSPVGLATTNEAMRHPTAPSVPRCFPECSRQVHRRIPTVARNNHNAPVRSPANHLAPCPSIPVRSHPWITTRHARQALRDSPFARP